MTEPNCLTDVSSFAAHAACGSSTIPPISSSSFASYHFLHRHRRRRARWSGELQSRRLRRVSCWVSLEELAHHPLGPADGRNYLHALDRGPQCSLAQSIDVGGFGTEYKLLPPHWVWSSVTWMGVCWHRRCCHLCLDRETRIWMARPKWGSAIRWCQFV